MCILFVYTLLKVVSHYDVSVLYMSVMGFHKKSLNGEMGEWDEVYPSLFLDFWNFFNFAKPLTRCSKWKKLLLMARITGLLMLHIFYNANAQQLDLFVEIQYA